MPENEYKKVPPRQGGTFVNEYYLAMISFLVTTPSLETTFRV